MLRIADPSDSRPFRLGAILAGGHSRRFGTPKPLAELGGVLVVERIAGALRRAGAHPVLITAPHLPDLGHLLTCRHDERPDLGPLGGLLTALHWAHELGARGCLCVACDMPFAPPDLLRCLAETGERASIEIVAPENSRGDAVEPLCAWYPTAIVGEIQRRLDAQLLSMRDLLGSLPVRRLPLSELPLSPSPEICFLNINTPDDHARATAHLSAQEQTNGRSA